MFGAIFALIILPVLIIGMSVVVFFVSRETPEEKGKQEREEKNDADL